MFFPPKLEGPDLSVRFNNGPAWASPLRVVNKNFSAREDGAMPVFKDVDVFIKPAGGGGGGGGGCGCIVLFIILGFIVMVPLVLGFANDEWPEYNHEQRLYRKCSGRRVFLIIELEKRCTAWYPWGTRLD